jgi:hypothetical protein
MGKIEKKRKKLEERIEYLENEMFLNLKQKTSSTGEISISKVQHEIQKLRLELQKL